MEMTAPFELEALKILEDFVPDKVFDVHVHIYDNQNMPGSGRDDFYTVESYRKDMSRILGNPSVIKINAIPMPHKTMGDPTVDTLAKTDAYILHQLEQDEDTIGEVMAYPGESAEHLAARFVHPRLVGIKCYHSLLQRPDTSQADIEEFLPQSAWEVAQEKKLAITLHMMRDQALAHPNNMTYIKTMAKRYPDARLILAHAARSFAPWTGLESVTELAGFENIWFDLAAVCESPVTFQILKKVSKERCMWGTDYPLVLPKGKVFALADSFYWLYQKEIDAFRPGVVPVHSWPIAVENLMATRQAAVMADLTAGEVEDLFYNNAARLFETDSQQ